MTAADVLEAVALLESAGLFVSVDGGWGVDALLGCQTRRHDDLDLVIDFEQVDAVREALSAAGFKLHIDEMPTRFVLRAGSDRRIDFHPMTFDRAGHAHQQLPDGRRFTCRAEDLDARGAISGHPVRCLTPAIQLAAHTGYNPDDIDRHDIRLLCDQFGLEPPEGY